ncbi:BRCA1-associated protein [Glycine soja]|uniref:BRCA1-associated protein n=2 Tax=Glycine soja TaxID=3848 RepID=A0A0B2QLR0_GLYSO|nr:BRCA1-associated protein [Glycine soja]KHN22420.1 BRCA1-associated protein [Glycine soja]RZB62312.1 BRCA1-associated protein isoform A [Glycine soja]
MWSSTSSTAAIPSDEEPSESSSSSSFSSSLFNFSSGNPRIEETRGLMHLFPDDTPSTLPVGRKPLVCVVGVPNHMTYADFCQFCGSFIQHMLEMRIVRMDGMEDQYSVLVRFDDQDSTDSFYKHYNGRRFSSLEVEVCRVLFTLDVQYTGSIEHAQPSNATSTELPTCPVCLERLDQDTGGILTTICNHSFHCSCISKWADSSCPVCRYCQQQAEKSICFVCQTTENLWICVICGYVGCGRYKGGHAIIHWKETQHCYSLEVETKRVWDYVGDNYVHRLIQSKTDGKLIELNTQCAHADNGCGSCSCEDNAMNEAILNSKVEAIVNEYNELLATQLENQKLYFESLLQEVKEESERKISKAVQKAISLKQQKIQSKIDRCKKEKKFLDDLNENLVKNEDIWKTKILAIEEREKKTTRLMDDRVADLEMQLGDLMVCLEGGRTVEQLAASDEIKEGIIDKSIESSTTSGSDLVGRDA